MSAVKDWALALLAVGQLLLAAANEGCLNDPFYCDIATNADIQYGEAVNAKSGLLESLLLDKYESPSAPSTGKPVGVFIHGGNCIGGSKNGYTDWPMRFARRGFVAVSINYRLQSDLASCRTPGSIEAAGSDAKAAVRYIKANAASWGIDTDRILISGCSAGARTSMWAAYAEGNGIDGTLHSTNNPGESANVTAVADVSGDLWAPMETPPIIDPGDPPVLIMHGTADTNAATLIHVAYEIQGNATNAGVYSELMIMDGAGHCPFCDIYGRMNQVYEFARVRLDLDAYCVMLPPSTSGMSCEGAPPNCAPIPAPTPLPTPGPTPPPTPLPTPDPTPLPTPGPTPPPTPGPTPSPTPGPTPPPTSGAACSVLGAASTWMQQRAQLISKLIFN